MRMLLFIFFSLSLITTSACSPKKSTKKAEVIVIDTLPKTQKNYRLRKYVHVKKLYMRLSKPVTDLCIKHKVPPGAVLSIMSLESGWGQGYVGQITGNFLSLNAVGNDAELPALELPSVNKTGIVLFDKNEISKYQEEELTWKKRPASLKKDYRPPPYAGTKENLAYLINNPTNMTQANLENVSDFVSRFISSKSSITAYREARKMLDEQIEQNGIKILFDKKLNEKFIKTIGGRPNSYNFRETWPVKVLSIMNGVGAVEISEDLHNNIPFSTAWTK